MQFSLPLPDEERAVSPVIGVILMVAITVLLGAIVSMLVLDMSQDIQPAPQASFGFEMNGDDVVITHEGGDTIRAADLTISIRNETTGLTEHEWTGEDYVRAGNSQSVAVNSAEEVRLIWSSNGDSAIIARYTVP